MYTDTAPVTLPSRRERIAPAVSVAFAYLSIPIFQQRLNASVPGKILCMLPCFRLGIMYLYRPIPTLLLRFPSAVPAWGGFVVTSHVCPAFLFCAHNMHGFVVMGQF